MKIFLLGSTDFNDFSSLNITSLIDLFLHPHYPQAAPNEFRCRFGQELLASKQSLGFTCLKADLFADWQVIGIFLRPSRVTGFVNYVFQ